MEKAILGTKIGMTQVFLSDGRVLPVTVVLAGPCTVVQVKSVERDGYSSVQFGFGAMDESRAKKLKNKPELGHFEKAGIKPTKYLREFKLDGADKMEVGQVVLADVFGEGERVDVVGTSKGKGTRGPIQRWGKHRGPMAHGSKYHRGAGGHSAGTYPGKVFKNHKGMGRTGGERVTVHNLEVVRVDTQRNLMLIKGAVPGPSGGLIMVKSTVKA